MQVPALPFSGRKQGSEGRTGLSETLILKGRKRPVRILRPAEYMAIEAVSDWHNYDEKPRLSGLLLTGLRYVEAQRFQDNPAWFDGKHIHLPYTAVLKSERKQADRWVWLSVRGREAVPKFLEAKRLPSWQTWGESLKRWAVEAGVDPIGLCPKTTRKTWESWLVRSYPQSTETVFLSQGHTAMTALRHYLNLPFSDEDVVRMKPWVEGFS